MSEDGEPSLSEYARFYGLTIDHLDIDPLAGLITTNQLQDIPEDEHILPYTDNLGIKDTNLRETLVVGKDEARLLGSIAEASLHNCGFDSGTELNSHRARDLKVETPMLRTDHESDVHAFGCPIMPDLANEHLPLESLDEEADEGLTWPSAYKELPNKYKQTLQKEKLEVSMEALHHLQAALCLDASSEAHQTLEGVCINYQRHTLHDPVEAPLMPMSPIVEPYEPSSDTGHLELLSENSSPIRGELVLIDRKVFGENTITKHEDDLVAIAREAEAILPELEQIGDIYSPLRGIEDPPSSPPQQRPPMRNFKVEVTLTPPQSVQPPPWKRKRVSFSEALREIISELPSPLPRPEDISSDDIDKLFAVNFGPIAVKAERGIEQEQLHEADTKHRVKVPVMDFSLPVALWKASNRGINSSNRDESHNGLLSGLKRIYFPKHMWPSSGANELSLQWMPFPAALGQVEMYEIITDDGLANEFLQQPQCVDYDTLIWKQEGLRIFDDLEDSDDELNYGIFPDEKDIAALVRKRKLELDEFRVSEPQNLEDDTTYRPLNKPVNHEAFRKVPRLSPNQKAETPKITQASHNQGDHAQPVASSFSTMSSLEGFMSLRNKGSTNSISTAQRFFRPKPLEVPSNTVMQQEQDVEPFIVQPASLPIRLVEYVRPPYKEAKPGTPFIVSTSFLSNRTIAKRVRQLYPTAEIIERDFFLHSKPSANHNPRLGDAASSSDAMANEADMILCPNTGLIITTLQKIRQRSLPGQNAQSAIRDRVQRAAPRYERLLIVVSHGSSQDLDTRAKYSAADPSSDGDSEAVADFAAFCSGVNEECRTIMVPEREEDTAQWIVSLMAKYGLHDSHVRLLQDETLWEVFLRRAGMNAFAAQAILSELKPPESGTSESHTIKINLGRFGLSAFIKMSPKERLARFKLLLGGSIMLTRLSALLDSRW